MYFEIIDKIENLETLAVGGSIRISCGFVTSMVRDVGGNSKVPPRFVWRVGESAMPSCIGMKPMALEERR